MNSQFYRWCQDGGSTVASSHMAGLLDIQLGQLNWWDLTRGIEQLSIRKPVKAFFDADLERLPDFPFTNFDIHVHSPKLQTLILNESNVRIQYIPLHIEVSSRRNESVDGFAIANYLEVIDSLDRQRSVYEEWTKDTLMFWEKRSWMLGTFRDIRRVVIDKEKAGDRKLFLLWGDKMVIVRHDLKQEIERAGITGCQFYALETS